MPKTIRPSGNWGETQKKALRDLVDANKIDLARKDSNYLWEICNLDPFKPFISDSSAGKSSAIQCMRKEFLRINAELDLAGARRKGMCVNSIPQSKCFFAHTISHI
jgi:hypothetical protein